jgi:small-conductance mechanosensitive channel
MVCLVFGCHKAVTDLPNQLHTAYSVFVPNSRGFQFCAYAVMKDRRHRVTIVVSSSTTAQKILVVVVAAVDNRSKTT